MDQKTTPPPLPTTYEGFLALRQGKVVFTLNDHTEAIIKSIYKDPALAERFQRLMYATHDEQALEGSLGTDNTLAAMMIRDKAVDIDNKEVSEQKLATLVKSMNIVMRRYQTSRKQRRNMVGGEYVAPEGNGREE